MNKRIASLVVLLGVLVLVGRQVYSTWDFEAMQAMEFRLVPFLLSLFFIYAHLLNMSWWSYRVLARREQVSFRQYVGIYFASQLGRYVPGKVWMVVGKVVFLEKLGISKSWIAFSALLEMMLVIAAAALLSGAGAGVYSQTLGPLWGVGGWVICCSAVLGILLFRQQWGVLEWIAKKAMPQWDEQKFRNPYGKAEIPVIALGFLGTWVLQGVAFVFLVITVTEVSSQWFLYLGCAYALAWITGFVALFAPSGLGVREGVLLVLLSPIMGPTEAAVVVMAARLWSLFADVSLGTVSYLRQAG